MGIHKNIKKFILSPRPTTTPYQALKKHKKDRLFFYIVHLYTSNKHNCPVLLFLFHLLNYCSLSLSLQPQWLPPLLFVTSFLFSIYLLSTPILTYLIFFCQRIKERLQDYVVFVLQKSVLIKYI